MSDFLAIVTRMSGTLEKPRPSPEQERVYATLIRQIEQIMRDLHVPSHVIVDKTDGIFKPENNIGEDTEKLDRSYGVPLTFDPKNKATKDALKKLNQEVPSGRVYMIVCGVIDAARNTSLEPGEEDLRGHTVRFQAIDPADLNRSSQELRDLSEAYAYSKQNNPTIDRFIFADALNTGRLPVGIENLTSPFSLYRISAGGLGPPIAESI